MGKPYRKPELSCYGSVSLGYYSPSNAMADCLCDCANASCSNVVSDVACTYDVGICHADACPGSDENCSLSGCV